MVSATITEARRKALEALYDGRCSVYVQGKTTNSVTKETVFGEFLILDDIPCRLSFKTISSTEPVEGVATQSQSVKLFLAPEHEIFVGSKIVVTQNGRETAYSRSGPPAVYSDHQEVPLELFKGFA